MSGLVGRGPHGTDVGLRCRPGRGRWFTAAAMACGAFTVLLGVLLMHSVPMVHPPGGHSVAGAPIASTMHPAAGHGHTDVELAASVVHGSGAVLEMGCSGDCSPHAGMAMCMAVISVVAALLIVRRLLTHRPGADGAYSQARWMGRYASRAPPWTTPSLEKLSVLRI